MTTTSFVVGLLGDNIGGSLAKPLQEGEGEAQGLSLAYRLVDATHTGLGLDDTAEVLRWAVRLGFDGLAVTHPFKNAVMGSVDDATPEAQALGASNLVVVHDGQTIAHNTDWVGFAEALRATLPEALGDRMVLLGAGGAGVAVGYGALRYGAAHLDIVDQDADRAAAVAARLGSLVGTHRVAATSDLERALRGAGGLIQATPVGMDAHPGLPVDPRLLRLDHWVADIIYFPLETELVHRARAVGCRVMTGGAMAVHQHAAAFRLLTGRPADIRRMQEHFESLTGQHVALSG
ncbi:MAG TPA: shikimate dehydrogenase [Lapillicoccus sp.]|jgi:shikimate dehydrogenase|nr:shikimate dehydrogenase [Lapillicoccus sp.]